MNLCKQIMDGMAATKMNVLHFHASDFGAFRVETKKYPQLTSGLHGQFYKQSDIKELVAYAKARGIRIVPEFDIPGHSSGFAPLAGAGMQFCSTKREQLYDDPKNQTYSMLIDIFSEMIPLFPDEIFHLGCDETSVVGPCTLDKTRILEEKLFRFLEREGKMPMGWDEIYFTTKSAINGSVIELWHSNAAGTTTSAGYYSVDANDAQLYLDSPTSCTIPNTKKNCMWLDIAPDFTPAQLKYMYGGETAMWCDHYIGTGDVSWMSEVKYTQVFEESFSSCIWPRGAAAGASFWNYRADLTTQDAEFLRRYEAHNARLISRGITTCPDKCVCTQEARCGKKYVK